MQEISDKEWRIIWYFVHRCSGLYQLDVDEVLSTALWLYTKAKNDYDESKSQFTTWLWTILSKKLPNHCQEIIDETAPLVEAADEAIFGSRMYDPERLVMFWEGLEKGKGLSEDARRLLQMLFDSPKKFFHLPPRAVRGQLVDKALKRVFDKPEHRLPQHWWSVIRELKAYFSQEAT
jgi:DNA-directed RNA polymerase specialized sigma24 family protein